MINKILIAVMVCVCSSHGIAQDEAESKNNDLPYFAIGAGAVFSDSVYKDEDTRVIPVPNVVYLSEDYYLKGLTAGKWLIGSREGFKLAAQIGGRLEYIDDDESDYYDGMDPRRPTLEAGILAEYSFMGKYAVSFDAMTDVMSEHDGYELSLSISERIPAIFNNENLSLNLTAGASWRSENLNDYYFGVRNDEARSGRPAYNAGGGFNYLLGASLNYKINDRWSWFNAVGITFMADEISDSPLVDDDHSLSIFTGISYKL